MLDTIADILYRCFLISFIILFATLGIYLLAEPFFTGFLSTVFHVPADVAGLTVMYFYGWIKIFAIFGFFVPAFAITWYQKSKK